MLKLTRLNGNVIALNPDHIQAAEALPDTTLHLIGGGTIIVKESLDELMALAVAFRRTIRLPFETGDVNPSAVGAMTACQKAASDHEHGGPSSHGNGVSSRRGR